MGGVGTTNPREPSWALEAVSEERLTLLSLGGGMIDRERVGGRSSKAAVLYRLPPHASHQWHNGACHVG